MTLNIPGISQLSVYPTALSQTLSSFLSHYCMILRLMHSEPLPSQDVDRPSEDQQPQVLLPAPLHLT